jgi:hypothetical protein
MIKRKFWVFVGLLALTFVSCKNNHSSHTEEKDETSETPAIKGIAYSKVFTDSFQLVLNRYYDLKDAFVKSDTAGVRVTGLAMKEAVAVFSVKEVEGKDSLVYQAVQSKPADLLRGLEEISKENDLEKQRASFEMISQAMYDLLQSLKPTGIHAYNQFCPMAFNDRGAYWLSAADSIMNPYFGKKMLHCGEVKEDLRFE